MERILCEEENYPPALLAVAGHGIPGSTRPFPADPLGEKEWCQVLAAARSHRLVGLLRAAIDGGEMPATADQARQARSAHLSVTLRALSLERELITVVDVLGASAIETRILKGTAVAHLDYPQPALRSFIDLDVLVRPGDIGEAVRALGDIGLVRTLPEPRPGFDRRFDKGTTLRSAAGFELDLHRTFVLGPWGVLVDLEDLWDGGQEFVVGGRPMHALSRVNRFLHACYHATLGDWPLRLASLRDVAEMVRQLDPRDGGATIRLAGMWGVEVVVAAAVADTYRLLGITTSRGLVSWAQQYVPSGREVARLALYTHSNRTFAAQAAATISVIPGLRDKIAYGRALIMPDPAYTAGRHASALARFRFAAREMRRGRGLGSR